MSTSLLTEAFPSLFLELSPPSTSVVPAGATTFHPFPRLATELKIAIFNFAATNLNLSPETLDALSNSYDFLITGPSMHDRRNRHGVKSPMVSAATETRVWMHKSLRHRLVNDGFYDLLGGCRLSRQMVLEFWKRKLEMCADFYEAPPKGGQDEFTEVTVYRNEQKDALMDVLEELIEMMKGEERATCGPPPLMTLNEEWEYARTSKAVMGPVPLGPVEEW